MVQRLNIRSIHGPHGNNHIEGRKNIDNGVRLPTGTIDPVRGLALIDTVVIVTVCYRT